MPPRKQAPQPLPQTNTLGSVEIAEKAQVGVPIEDDVMESREEALVETSVPPIGNEEPPDDIGRYPDVTLDEAAQPVAKNPNWIVVDALSDDEFQVEAAKLDGYQFRMSILRFRLHGELLSNVVTLPGVTYQKATGQFQNRG